MDKLVSNALLSIKQACCDKIMELDHTGYLRNKKKHLGITCIKYFKLTILWLSICLRETKSAGLNKCLSLYVITALKLTLDSVKACTRLDIE